ncbi:hypothetical protein AMTR_s00186p00031950 [Amborella trichopoda]|uniref:Uncharacterized protein n=1 Tax=Amborella trichopoda TaxID=13333 RepID=W1P9Z4_AMBTC|nr:hypothetical protein AMTR_s00186p00031950 [Amborella trichopoda]
MLDFGKTCGWETRLWGLLPLSLLIATWSRLNELGMTEPRSSFRRAFHVVGPAIAANEEVIVVEVIEPKEAISSGSEI